MSAASDLKLFQQKLSGYKKLIDDDIEAYAKKLRTETPKNYGQVSAAAVDAYLSILSRGGKRIRGALTIAGYEMAGGTDKAMILTAARAIEMLHAYILITDDIADNSDVRRGGPAAHIILADYHNQNNLIGNDGHFGESVAVAASLIGAHSAMAELAALKVAGDLKINAIGAVNRGLAVTGHGQINDLYNEFAAEVSEEQVHKVQEWKTAHYTFLNPLQLGLILADAPEDSVAKVKDYALNAGQAFQITDDILGIFGDEKTSGKSPMDDLREGKRTLLSVYALAHAGENDRQFLEHMLGNIYLTPEEFSRCKQIIEKSGALKHAKDQALRHGQAALQALAKAPADWDEAGVKFLRGIIEYILNRNS